MTRYLLLALALLSVLVFALATPAVGQEPQPPTGEEQPTEEVPGAPNEPAETTPAPAPPADNGAQAPATSGGTLPYSGLEALWIALAGIVLLLAGARLRVVSRIRAVARRQMTPKVALRASLEELRAAGVDEARRAAQGPPPVEPSTVSARRMAQR